MTHKGPEDSEGPDTVFQSFEVELRVKDIVWEKVIVTTQAQDGMQC